MTPDEFSKLLDQDFKSYLLANTSADGTVSKEAVRKAVVIFIASTKAATEVLQEMLKEQE